MILRKEPKPLKTNESIYDFLSVTGREFPLQFHLEENCNEISSVFVSMSQECCYVQSHYHSSITL